MIALVGDLAVFSPVDVLQFLGLAGAKGVLEMTRGLDRVRLAFEDGRIVGAEGKSPRPRLGELLREAGHITESDLERGLLEGQRTGKLLGEALVGAGLPVDCLDDALEEQVVRTIFLLLKWNSGRFQFQAGVKAGGIQISLKTPLHSLLFEGLKRMDEEAVGGAAP